MLATVQATVREHRLFLPKEKVLVAVSGGLDSVMLFHVMLRLREELALQPAVVHVDHGLRGEESAEDARFVERLAESHGVPCYARRFDVAAYAEERKLSIQAAAREVRYRYFAVVAEEKGFAKLATAHHADDQAETVLMGMVRGTSMRGLAGIPLRREERHGAFSYEIVRPMLEVYREEIEAEAQRIGAVHREDPSNASDKYLRNKIRIRLLPYLEQEFNPGVRQALVQMAGRAREDDTYLSKLAQAALAEHVEENGGIYRVNSTALREMPLPLQRRVIALILYYLRGHTIQWEQVHMEAVRRLLHAMPSARAELPGGVWAWREYEMLCMGDARGSVLPESQDTPASSRQSIEELAIPGSYAFPHLGLRLELTVSEGVPARPKDAWEAQFDADELSRSRIYIRTWGQGDTMRPLGLGGSKLISDLFIDEKVPRHKRDTWPLFCIGDGIAWAVGLRRGEGALVNERTTRTVTARATRLSSE